MPTFGLMPFSGDPAIPRVDGTRAPIVLFEVADPLPDTPLVDGPRTDGGVAALPLGTRAVGV